MHATGRLRQRLMPSILANPDDVNLLPAATRERRQVAGLCLLAAGLVLMLAGCASTDTPETLAKPRTAVSRTAVKAINVHVDHAWVKTTGSPTKQTKQRRAMELLRSKIAAGGTFIDSWNALGVDGRIWHVAEHETYPYEIIPAGARDLPEGALSPIIPGDGGLHLFRILGRDAAE